MLSSKIKNYRHFIVAYTKQKNILCHNSREVAVTILPISKRQLPYRVEADMNHICIETVATSTSTVPLNPGT